MNASSRLKRYLKSFVLYLAPVIVAAVIVAYFSLQSMSVLPRQGLSPGYSLTDQSGQTVTNIDLRGSVVLYTFTDTDIDCLLDCPNTTRIMRQISDGLDSADWTNYETGVRLVSIALDSDQDKPEALSTYARAAGAIPADWSILIGDPTILKTVVGRGFKVFYETRVDGSVDFDPAFIIVDEVGIIRAEYRNGLPDSDDLIDDLRSVTIEANSGGITGLAYGAAHLLTCSGR